MAPGIADVIESERATPRRNKRPMRRLAARIASLLLDPRTATASIVICIAAFAVVGLLVLIGMKSGQDLFMDSAEAYAWGMQFLGGYGRHPPLTGWIARVWYSVFPAANWSSYVLSRIMTAIALGGIYLIAQRVAGRRRALLVVFAMMLYPLFIGAKSDRFNTYQVLLAVLPVAVWLFLRAYARPTAVAGAALGLAAAAAMLTIYSAIFALIGMALAAVLHPARRRFFTSAAPYTAAVVFVLALIPHIVWLTGGDFSSLRWAYVSVGEASTQSHVAGYLGHHLVLLAFCLAGAALALWPWRRRIGPAAPDAPAVSSPADACTGERLLIFIIAAVLVAGPPLLSFVFNFFLKVDWGNPLFFLVPLVVLAALPKLLVTRRAVARGAMIAATFAAVLLVGGPIYSWANFRMHPAYGAYIPFSEMAVEVTRLWRERFHSRLPIVVAGFELAAPVVFYSPDHPKMFADYNPDFSPWIDYPAELARMGYVGVCYDDDSYCRDYLKSLNPDAERLEVKVWRQRQGIATPPLKLHLEFTAPKPR